MRIRFLGAANEVTGSMHLLETDEGSMLVDCGLYQGRRDESRERNRNLPREAVKADVVLLTHAHIDHAGSIPTLCKRGYPGTIYATPATRDLCAYMLRDSARIQEGDAAYLNKKFGQDPEWKTIQPIYDEDDAVEALKHFVAVPYGKPFSPLPKVQATFLDAGHILGSAQILLDIDVKGRGGSSGSAGRGAEGPPNRRRLLFSGDLGRKGLPILRDPETPQPPIDYVLMESTYGGRVHGSVSQMQDDLARVVNDTVKRGGKVIIPAFAVGRTQEIIYFMAQLKRAGRLPDVPVFIDSPLSVNVTSVFKLHPECYDKETRTFLDEHGEVFDFQGIRFVQSREESIRLNSLREPAVIISSSGMCEAGRIVHHLKNNVEDEKNTILIVGYQAQHTLGRRIVERRPRVRVLGVERDLRAHVEVLNSFSAHADRNDLLAFAGSLGGGTRHHYLIHGEPAQQEPLLASLAERKLPASAPARGAVEELP